MVRLEDTHTGMCNLTGMYLLNHCDTLKNKLNHCDMLKNKRNHCDMLKNVFVQICFETD